MPNPVAHINYRAERNGKPAGDKLKVWMGDVEYNIPRKKSVVQEYLDKGEQVYLIKGRWNIKVNGKFVDIEQDKTCKNEEE